MSKHLAKIISICVIAVLLPLAIVAVAITATQSVGVSVTVAQAGTNATHSGTSSDVAIYIDSQKQEEATVEIRKNSKVTVTFSGVGYYFEGWFEGNAEEINEEDTAISTSKSYEFSATKNMVLTAVRNVQKYNITFSGEDAEGQAIEIQAQTGVEYNTALPVLQGNESKIFAGWNVKDAETVAPSFYANYAVNSQNAEIELVPVWKENASYTVFYSVNDNTAENSWEMVYNTTTGFQSYPKAELRSGYTFTGITIDGSGKVYAYNDQAKDYICAGEKLSDALIKNPTAILYAVWECNYPTIGFSFEARANYTGESYGQLLYTNTEDGLVAIKDTAFTTLEISDENDIDLDDNFYDYFMGAFADVVTSDGKACVFNGTIRFDLKGTIVSKDLHFLDDEVENVMYEDITFRNVYEKLSAAFGSENISAGFEVYFMFDIA